MGEEQGELYSQVWQVASYPDGEEWLAVTSCEGTVPLMRGLLSP